MAGPPPSRRQFLADSGRFLSGGWLALQLPALAALSACAREAALQGDPLLTFSAAEAETMSAFAALIIPTDDLPGATEAGAVYFIDRALDGPLAELRDPVLAGIADLDARASRLDPAANRFADLSHERQATLMGEIESEEFFFLGRMLTVMGVFAEPSYGGNRGRAGMQILGYEPHGAYQPPFGWYDEEHARSGGAA